MVGFGDFFFALLYGTTFYLLVELPFKKFIHELLFAKVIDKVKKEIGFQENQNQSTVWDNDELCNSVILTFCK